ncbi:MAG: asparagine synthase-related protein [Candidatus Omnitrophota bacterium]
MNTIEKILSSAVPQHNPPGKIAVFATGGLDSTVLACLARTSQPHLIFGAVQDDSQQAYNTAAIHTCQKINRILQLPLTIVPISAKDWLKSFFHLAQILEKPITDTDLPAAALLFQKTQSLGLNTALSGMGSDNIFNLSKKQLTQFMRSEGNPGVKIHAEIAALYGITFLCPFLRKPMLDYALSTPLKARQGKKDLLDIFNSHPELLRLMRTRTPAHSITPPSFLLPLKTLIKKKSAASNRSAFFTHAADLAWQHYHPSSLLVHPQGA